MKSATANTLTNVGQCKIQKITNNSGTDIVIGLPLTSAETEKSNPIVSYSKDFVLLYVSGGETVIKNSSSDKVTLNRTYVDTDRKEEIYLQGYDLLMSRPTWLAPVANIGVLQDYDDDTNLSFFDP